MSVETPTLEHPEHFSDLCDRAEKSSSPIIIQRAGHADVVLVALSEWQSLSETAHLLRSPANARRLLAALDCSLRDEVEPMSLDELRREVDSAIES